MNNIADYFKAGCAALGVGSSLLSKEVLDRSDWAEVTRRAAELVQAARHARPGAGRSPSEARV
jgi:2-dehydro-3-deoxyphosphogluconate aldolase/(4S)-4-hydroxy-2-oxoglutarate aldolase